MKKQEITNYIIGIAFLFILISFYGCNEDRSWEKVLFINKADSLYEKDKVNEALNYYNEALKIDSNDAILYMKIGVCNNDLKKFNIGLEAFNKCIEIDSLNYQAIGSRGRAKKNLNDYEGAMNDYNKSLKMQSLQYSVLNNRGHLYLLLGNIDSAWADFNKSIKINPGFLPAYANRARIKFEYYKDYEGAIIDCSKALTEIKSDEIYFNRGVCYYYTEQYEKSYSDLIKAIEINPTQSRYYFNMACLLFKTNNNEEGCKYLLKAIDMGNEKAIEFSKDNKCN